MSIILMGPFTLHEGRRLGMMGLFNWWIDLDAFLVNITTLSSCVDYGEMSQAA